MAGATKAKRKHHGLVTLFGWANLDGDSEDPFRASALRASPVAHALPPTDRFGSARGIHGVALTGLRYRPVGELPGDIRRLAGDIR